MLSMAFPGRGGDVADEGVNDGVRLTDEQRLDWLHNGIDIARIFGCMSQRCRNVA
jgi:hypothetical protein